MTEPAPPHRQPEENPRHGRLTARPAPAVTRGGTGIVPFTAPNGEPLALAYAPAGADGPYRLVLLLHGAGGSARQGLDLLLPLADAHRLLLLAPQAVASTWDLIVEGFGPDVRRIDELLRTVFEAYPVAEEVVVGGFSDGASYALSLGLTNGDLFGAVLAFSPGFAAPLVTHGRPRIFVSHGTGDRVLPVDVCSRRLVPRLHGLGYQVDYAEFTGGHEVPAEIRQRAVGWLTG